MIGTTDGSLIQRMDGGLLIQRMDGWNNEWIIDTADV
jgi:hypothetical protein